GLPVGDNRRMKVEFRRATLSPSGDHFSTSNNFWDASPFLGDGGLAALGANLISMALLPAAVVAVISRKWDGGTLNL
ncbi:MAG: energy-coupling factor ABC transporter permease, partial [Planctomycetaceae bacterium]